MRLFKNIGKKAKDEFSLYPSRAKKTTITPSRLERLNGTTHVVDVQTLAPQAKEEVTVVAKPEIKQDLNAVVKPEIKLEGKAKAEQKVSKPAEVVVPQDPQKAQRIDLIKFIPSLTIAMFRNTFYFFTHLPQDIFHGARKINRKNIMLFLKLFVWDILTFVFLLTIYLAAKLITVLNEQGLVPRFVKKYLQSPLDRFYKKVISMNRHGVDSINRVNLIELALRNMAFKRSRAVITIGGMAVGIGIIVLLVSIGYGVEHLVTSRVARLDELRQADVSPQTGGIAKINDKTLSQIQQMKNVKEVLPLIAVVGHVNYNNSATDVAVFGVTSDYLLQSAIKTVSGKIFDSNKLVTEVVSQPEVAGASTSIYDVPEGGLENGAKIQNTEFSINPGEWLRVRDTPTQAGKILGYTKRLEGKQSGAEYWGDSYDSTDNVGKSGVTATGAKLGRWIKSPLLLWEEKPCDATKDGDCEGGKYKVMRSSDNTQVQKEGYIAEINITMGDSLSTKSSVLGISTTTDASSSDSAAIDDTQTSTSDSSSVGTIASVGNGDFVEIASESGLIKPPNTKKIPLNGAALKQAVVSRAMLKVLGIPETQAIGKKFNASFVVVQSLLASGEQNVESNPAVYTIIGVIPDDKTPIFYVPFIDLRSLGVVNYSQAKIVDNQNSDLPYTRKQVESLGFVTTSVADTVAQIEQLFGTARLVLGLLGTVALAVAALGMFNTLTVSLLERTREVGLMKAMGMRSQEVKELFLTESMVMGFFGGVFGLILGTIAGKLLGGIVSIVSVARGGGLLDVSYVPIPFVLFILGVSLLVGIITGFYPARRATKISALNALRYE